MSATILSTGLVSSLGLSAAATCAALRAGLSHATETHFMDAEGQPIIAHQVALDSAWRGRTKLVNMAALAVEDCLADLPRTDWQQVPLLLCCAERDRPGRLEGLEETLLIDIERTLGIHFSDLSGVVPQGRVSTITALTHARRLLMDGRAPLVLIAATDSLITWPTLVVYEKAQRLLTAENSNGFMPGEGAGALLVGPAGTAPHLTCTGVGFSTERATVVSEDPLRADGLTTAINAALADAGCALHHLDLRIADLSGEQYYFKEAALAMARIMRVRREEFDLWHPAEGIGETGAVAGLAMLAVAWMACEKAYAPGPNILCHVSNDAGQRAAAVMQMRAT
jgi:3-oxoacyl-[acyl-carrier-protein] synthase-1